MLLSNLCRRSAMSKHKVEKNLHTKRVSLLHEVAEILVCSVLGVYVEVVARTIRVARIVEARLMLARTPLGLIHIGVGNAHRCEVNHSYTQIGNALEVFLRTLQGSLLAEAARLELIAESLLKPRWRLASRKMAI